MSTPRPFTKEEIQEKFLKQVHDWIYYFDSMVDSKMSQRERLEGLAFSILVTIDGESMMVPGFKMIALSHEQNRQEYIAAGENYYPAEEDEVDIAGSLHDHLFRSLDV